MDGSSCHLDPPDRPHPGIPLFAPHEKVYPRSVQGPIRRIKWLVLAACLSAYYIAPWLRWDRGPGRPDQAFLIDMTGRRAFILGIEIWPQEIFYLAGLLIVGAVGLFFVTSLFGRLWCGYTCPQTVWTDLFLWAERWVEGDRTQRIRLDAEPLSWRKISRKAVKHLIWLLIAALTGGAWVMYFNDAPTLLRDLFTLKASLAQYSFLGLFTATTYLLAGWAREQVCTYMCPWPRFQSAMIDEETLVVTYRDWRGEPRGKHKKAASWAGRGDCVDCHACVAVCPTGIDIRDGLQLECIGCGLCIDACDDIMTKVGRPKGLIGFDTETRRRMATQTAPLRLVRPRTVLYTIALLGAIVVMAISFAQRGTLTATVLPDRSPLFVRLSNAMIGNAYTLKIENRTAYERRFLVTMEGVEGARLHLAETDEPPVMAAQGVYATVRADAVGAFRMIVTAPLPAVSDLPATFHIHAAESEEDVTYHTSFRGPGK